MLSYGMPRNLVEIFRRFGNVLHLLHYLHQSITNRVFQVIVNLSTSIPFAVFACEPLYPLCTHERQITIRWLLCLLAYTEDRVSRFLRNIGTFLPDSSTSQKPVAVFMVIAVRTWKPSQ